MTLSLYSQLRHVTLRRVPSARRGVGLTMYALGVINPGEILKLRGEAAGLDLTLPQYLSAVVKHRRADLVSVAIQTER